MFVVVERELLRTLSSKTYKIEIKGQYETASEYAKRSFDASRQMHDLNHLDYNRVLFGISTAHKNLKYFEKNVEFAKRKNINNLIWWKYDSRREMLLRDFIVNNNNNNADDDYDDDNNNSGGYEYHNN